MTDTTKLIGTFLRRLRQRLIDFIGELYKVQEIGRRVVRILHWGDLIRKNFLHMMLFRDIYKVFVLCYCI